MDRRLRALLVAVALALGATSAADDPIADRVVAVVRSSPQAQPRVLTLSRVEEEARVALIARGGALAASAPLDSAALRAGLEWAVDQTLLADEASRLQVLEADPADVAAELQRFKARFATPADYGAFLARLDATDDEIAAILRRTLAVKRYVEGRVGRAGDGADAERVAREVRSLVADLRARAEVRILYDLGAAAPAAPAPRGDGGAATARRGK
jgi:hypothetical protein